MLEWMRDGDITRGFRTNFAAKTLADAEDFIRANQASSENVHLAIASDADKYMGTVSLKHIDRERRDAEFAIVVRRIAMGCGYAWYGMKSILDVAFNELGLDIVYWNVLRENRRAMHFYDKHKFQGMSLVPKDILGRYPTEMLKDLKWYSVSKAKRS